MPYDDQTDMSDVAEMAHDHGIAYYETMSGVSRGVLNVLAVGLCPCGQETHAAARW